MRIQKIGHCCLLIKTKGILILTDPGEFSTGQGALSGVDVIIISHEHADHLHIASLQEVLKHNPSAQVVTNAGVGALLTAAGITYTTVKGGDMLSIKGVELEVFDAKHEEIYEAIGQVANTGFYIDHTFFYPGDSFHDPERSIDILALPVTGPWCKIPEAIRYALALKPKHAFPVHDGMLRSDQVGAAHKVTEKVLSENGIAFVALCEGDTHEFE